MSTENFDWEKWIPERMQKGTPYTPGEQRNTSDWIKLNTNEFPYAPSPRVLEAIQLGVDRLRLYPNPTGEPLREAIGEYHGVSAEQVVIFNGCDDALNCCIRGFTEPEESIGMLNPSYSLYQTLIKNHGAKLNHVEYEADFAFPVETLIADESKVFIFTSPNAPSGRAFSKAELAEVLGRREGIVVLDETYAEFSDWTAIDLISEYPNVMVVRSFSKTFGLAGMRVGYAIGAPEAVNVLHLIRDVYNVNHLSQLAAEAAIRDTSYYSQKVNELVETREKLCTFLSEKLKWKCVPSSTNFLFFYPSLMGGEPSPVTAKSLFSFLVEEKVLLRYFSNHSLVESGLRMSIGTAAQMETVCNLIEKWANREQQK